VSTAALGSGCAGQIDEGPPDGLEVFLDNGCASCHTLSAASATAEVGPNLDRALRGRDQSFIRQSIVNPQARLAAGYGRTMPGGYGERLSPDELGALVAFLSRSAGGR
jgi:cytochrome c oxidase subunit II